MGQIVEYPIAVAITDSDTALGVVGGATKQIPTNLFRGLSPAHEWLGTSVRFQNPDNTWGDYTELKGATGLKGDMPPHEWSGTQLRFQNPDGSWGNYVDLKGAKGDTGAIGPQGPAGTNGTNGTNGTAATIAVGTVTTLAAGASATVSNSGTANAAVFDFGIPKGADGAGGSGDSGGASLSYIDAYSTTEFKTNKYHSDGRPIYRKLVDFGAMPNNATKNVAHGITNISDVTSMQFLWKQSPTIQYGNAPFVSNTTSWIKTYADTTNVIATTAVDYSACTGKVVMEYTKTTDASGAIPTSILTTGGATGYVDAFSSTEYKTNKFHVDGKPIYRKVIDAGAMPNNAIKTVAHSAANVGLVVNVRGFAVSGTDSRPLPYATNNPSWGMEVQADGTNVKLTTANDWSTYSAKVILEYTKTTDSTGSIPGSVDDTVYSTSETAIGKWIDGKTIYRKVVNFGALPNSATKTIAHNISNASAFTKVDALAVETNLRTIELPLANSTLTSQIYSQVDNTYCRIDTYSNNFIAYSCIFILEYTCTDR